MKRPNDYLIGAGNGRQAHVDPIVFPELDAAHENAIQIEGKCWQQIERHFRLECAKKIRIEKNPS